MDRETKQEDGTMKENQNKIKTQTEEFYCKRTNATLHFILWGADLENSIGPFTTLADAEKQRLKPGFTRWATKKTLQRTGQ
jgi:hypothetical protein